MYRCHTVAWYSYIDDIFVLWDGPPTLLADFIVILNQNNYNLHFTMESDVKTG